MPQNELINNASGLDWTAIHEQRSTNLHFLSPQSVFTYGGWASCRVIVTSPGRYTLAEAPHTPAALFAAAAIDATAAVRATATRTRFIAATTATKATTGDASISECFVEREDLHGSPVLVLMPSLHGTRFRRRWYSGRCHRLMDVLKAWLTRVLLRWQGWCRGWRARSSRP